MSTVGGEVLVKTDIYYEMTIIKKICKRTVSEIKVVIIPESTGSPVGERYVLYEEVE